MLGVHDAPVAQVSQCRCQCSRERQRYSRLVGLANALRSGWPHVILGRVAHEHRLLAGDAPDAADVQQRLRAGLVREAALAADGWAVRRHGSARQDSDVQCEE